MNWLIVRLGLLLLLSGAAGCGSGRYPVTGRVTYEDGSPVEAGIVIAEATVENEPVSVQANVEKDGSFQWGTDVPGDGALPGNYRVIVMPVTLSDSEQAEGKRPAVHSKYSKYDTSGITFEVKPQDNVLNIQVTRPEARNK